MAEYILVDVNLVISGVSENILQFSIDSCLISVKQSYLAIKTAETMTLRPDPDTYRAVRAVCGNLCISVQEFLRRAVARELAYNSKKVK